MKNQSTNMDSDDNDSFISVSLAFIIIQILLIIVQVLFLLYIVGPLNYNVYKRLIKPCPSKCAVKFKLFKPSNLFLSRCKHQPSSTSLSLSHALSSSTLHGELLSLPLTSQTMSVLESCSSGSLFTHSSSLSSTGQPVR